jgi:hypothetical protein
LNRTTEATYKLTDCRAKVLVHSALRLFISDIGPSGLAQNLLENTTLREGITLIQEQCLLDRITSEVVDGVLGSSQRLRRGLQTIEDEALAFQKLFRKGLDVKDVERMGSNYPGRTGDAVADALAAPRILAELVSGFVEFLKARGTTRDEMVEWLEQLAAIQEPVGTVAAQV